jgi:hypothetical protein
MNGKWLTLWPFAGMCLFVATVSALDAYLVLMNWDAMPTCEENPVCLHLIRLGNGDASIFLRAKSGGTLFVLSVLTGIYRHDKLRGHFVAAGLTACQLALLCYLFS